MEILSKYFQENIQQLYESIRHLLFQLVHYRSDLNNHLKISELETQLKLILNEKLKTIIAEASLLHDLLVELQATSNVEDLESIIEKSVEEI